MSNQVLRVLHVDDDIFQLERMQSLLKRSQSKFAIDLTSLLRPEDLQRYLIDHSHFDLLICDVKFSEHELSGALLVEQVRSALPHAVVLMYSSFNDPQVIGTCLQAGADDFVMKDLDDDRLIKTLLTTYELCRGLRVQSNKQHSVLPSRHGIVGATLHAVAQRLVLILRSAVSSIHVHGESGTGKEVVADLLAEALPDGIPFVRINCAAITASLMESELFGYVRGAFTGAQNDRAGLLEAADGGWVFLDEVGMLSPAAQAALLRVLENQEVRRVGSTRPRKIQIKVLSATNEVLPDLVAAGKFRLDLWQRLCESEISLPPLRERVSEISALVQYFAGAMEGGPYQVSRAALQVLKAVPWREGNVRELRNCLRAMTELHVNRILTPMSIPPRVWDQYYEASSSDKKVAPPSTLAMLLPGDPEGSLDYAHWSDVLLLELARRAAGGKQMSLRQLAQIIGISRSTLSVRLRQLLESGLVTFEALSEMVNIHAPDVSGPRSRRQTVLTATNESASYL